MSFGVELADEVVTVVFRNEVIEVVGFGFGF